MNKQTILLIVLVLAVIAGGYVWYAYFFQSPKKDETPEVKKQVVSEEFLARAAILDRIKINTDFFSSPDFLKLEDGAAKPPLPETKGRTNPFAPL
ncbi:hypothetical protein HYT00_00040 [Candidatus Giovannonibacteria bacterium]|nr:hypothetical protein [Candidatus Giovannonibacteria bacterium]